MSTYFELSQELIATMIMSGAVKPLHPSSHGVVHHFIGPDSYVVPPEDTLHSTHSSSKPGPDHRRSPSSSTADSTSAPATSTSLSTQTQSTGLGTSSTPSMSNTRPQTASTTGASSSTAAPPLVEAQTPAVAAVVASFTRMPGMDCFPGENAWTNVMGARHSACLAACLHSHPDCSAVVVWRDWCFFRNKPDCGNFLEANPEHTIYLRISPPAAGKELSSARAPTAVPMRPSKAPQVPAGAGACPKAYQQCTACCEDGCTCVKKGASYSQCMPPAGAWKCGAPPRSEASVQVLVRKYTDAGAIGPTSSIRVLWLAIAGGLAAAVTTSLMAAGRRWAWARPLPLWPDEARAGGHGASGSGQPLMVEEEMSEVA